MFELLVGAFLVLSLCALALLIVSYVNGQSRRTRRTRWVAPPKSVGLKVVEAPPKRKMMVYDEGLEEIVEAAGDLAANVVEAALTKPELQIFDEPSKPPELQIYTPPVDTSPADAGSTFDAGSVDTGSFDAGSCDCGGGGGGGGD